MANVGSIASIEGGNYIETSDMQSKWEAVKVHADAVNANRAQANHQTSIPPATAEAAKSVSMPSGKSSGVRSGRDSSQQKNSSKAESEQAMVGSGTEFSEAEELKSVKKNQSDSLSETKENNELNAILDKVSRGDDLSSSELSLLKEKDPVLYSKVMQSMMAKTFEDQNKHVQAVSQGSHFSAEA
jgi:hypothetical protein